MNFSIPRAFRRPPVAPWDSEESIREELFSIERLEQHAETLAAAQRVTAKPTTGRSLAARLKDNETVLLEAYRAIAEAVDAGRTVTPAAEWVLDNYHLVEEQIREIRDDLAPGYYRQLPKLAAGPFAGYPRVFGVAWAFVAHTDSRFDPDMLCRFVRAYQRIEPLTIGELWAVAITLRIVLVENLRRAARRVAISRAQREEADSAADRLLGVGERAGEPVTTVLQRYEQTPLPESFAVQLVQRLHHHDPKVTPALTWLDQRLAAQDTTAEKMVREEHQRQGATNVTVRNVITSMRLISDVDWTELFERVSLVDDTLRSGREFANMDFPTRNLYRSAIEELARGSRLTELAIAQKALFAADGHRKLALQGGEGIDSRERDPGYFLIAGGRRDFERAIGFRPPIRTWPRRFNTMIGIPGYIANVVIVAALLLAAPLLYLAGANIGGWWFALAALGIIPALDTATALVNRMVSAGIGPAILPGLELRDGVPPHLRTLVAVPTLLTTRAAIEEQIEQLEIHYLASAEGDIHFALLSDWTDASSEHVAGDRGLLDAAAAGIARLNSRYGPADGGDRFLLLHRRRVWNDRQEQWLGWERKRGKLHELNRLLRGATDTTYLRLDGTKPQVPADIRYVLTLDADTRLPRDSVRRLVGKMAHPLNRPRFDPKSRRVVDGYGVLQPRVTPSMPVGREGSLFQRVFSGMSGIDPYSSTVSDVYQDLFGEGSYTGKGIYDVDAFAAALEGRIPENALLSHDLFEGIFARAGLASDIEVVEEYPARYDVACSRQHRWARGDWQLLPWLFGRGHGAPGDRRASAIPSLGLWKMSDNLRRTLSAPANVLALLAGWMLPPHEAAIWTAFILSAIALPHLLPVALAVIPKRSAITLRSHLVALAGDLWLALSQTTLFITFLAHQSWLMTDAILRTLFRLFVSHRHLLEWVTTAQVTVTVSSRLDLAGFYRQMIGAVAIAVGIVAALAINRVPPAIWILAAPFVLLWIASPAIARWTSISPLVAGRLSIAAADITALRLIGRRTWRYFETFVTPDDHMLPPDNFQETPKPTVAHRTSPTNIGLYLLSAVSACDFGWAGRSETVERLEATLSTMEALQKFRGHCYNWYDTRDLSPLNPQYVSSVDSGNLAGHLIALANAARAWADRPLPGPHWFVGIDDALTLARASLLSLPDDRRTETITQAELKDAIGAVAAAIPKFPLDPEERSSCLATLLPLATTLVDVTRALTGERGDDAADDLLYWAQATQRAIIGHQCDITLSTAEAHSLRQRLAAIDVKARALADAMEFGFLYDISRKLLSIGYMVPEGRSDQSCYDLLASEARLASFVAIAKGDVPARHWFRLGRAVTPIDSGAALISWSGSMFEYLMPSLVMRAPAGSLIYQTNRLIVARQIAYGDALGVPWGISESAYNVRDLEFTYQYSNFGIPGLGLKRGLSQDSVVAPYATALAAMVDPRAAARNFARLAALGACGRFGFYEALDYTRARLPEGKDVAIVRAYMAHHQGMTIVAIANALLDGSMRARFHAEPIIQATELLLQERTPRDIAAAHPRAEEVETPAKVRDIALPLLRRLRTAHDVQPETQLLSNGHYGVMVTAAGSGYSRWRDLAVTRWREDVTRDDWGSYVFLRDVQSGQVWSAGYQPSGVEPSSYEVNFDEDRAEFARRDGALTTTLDVVVSPEDDAEVRRVTIANASSRVRTIEVTSYAELVLAPMAADIAHPAFSKLFVRTEYLAKIGALTATRRRRAPSDPEIWAAHLAVVEGEALGEPEIETDRARFIGRGRDARAPIAVIDGRPLSNATGDVLDPIFALRYCLRIEPQTSARIAFWTMAASSRNSVLDLIDKHHDANAYERATTLAWVQAQVQLSHLGIDGDEAALFQRLAGHVLYADPSMRPSSDTIRRGGGRQSGLWSQSISGDLPIVLVRIDDMDDIAIVGQLLRAHEYWRMKQFAVDLVILNERASSYVQDLQIALEALVRSTPSHPQIGPEGARGAVFTLRMDLISADIRDLLPAVARVVLVARRGTLSDQINRLTTPASAALPPTRRAPRPEPEKSLSVPPPDLAFFNGIGGFTEDGREYVTTLGAGQTTPAPWINVVANPNFGFQVSAEGSGYTWSLNSRENQLTPWSNDPVSDRPGEVIYVRDEDSGEIWGPTALPIRDDAPYVARHGHGYSRFEHTANGIALDLLQFVALDDPIKISRLRIRNSSSRARRLSVTAYVEWVLGPSRSASAPFVVTDIDAKTGAMFAHNPWNTAFRTGTAFADLAGRQTGWSGDRREFLGRNGTLEHPAALARKGALSKRVGAGLDPCGALQTAIDLPPNGSTEIVVFLGEAANASEAQLLIARYRAADLDAVFRVVTSYWEDVLGTVQVKTPDRALDVMLNGWLLYQTIACRVWARSAFYQASGAYGFRDQLQDGMALAVSRPAMTREHLLRAAARQFVEGDVQHWWLPSSGQGVRTRISDDRIWLAYAVAHYVATTGDRAVLDERIPFLDGLVLRPSEHEAYFLPMTADESGTLFEHCARGLDQSLAVGEHGLPLFGTGDWNDGMNRVGEDGRGESVWLGWFLHATLSAFAPLAEARNETTRAERWLSHMMALKTALERDGWDGQWFRRGYYDDGTPLGSSTSDECRIDSIAQSWSVISGAASTEHATRAMAAVEEHLIRKVDGLAPLFTPPFDKTTRDPGYIKGYPPGIRENGGQYTHAAAWSVIAYAMLGQGDQAAALLSLINPVNHASSRAGMHRYKVEPYVAAADVYSVAPHVGRGGWTWYTGSAGWIYRAGIEAILGLRPQAGFLGLDPCIPRHWPTFTVVYRHRSARYEILVENPNGVSRGVARIELDGEGLPADARGIALADDTRTHIVRVVLG